MISGVVQLADFSHIETLSRRSGFPNFFDFNPISPSPCCRGSEQDTTEAPEVGRA